MKTALFSCTLLSNSIELIIGQLKKTIYKILRILFPFVLGGGILYWMYRGFPFGDIKDILLHQMHWEWMLLSFIPGILAQVFRGLRWRQTLEPLDEHPSSKSCIHAIFLSYAASLLVPRIGELLRCGVLHRQEGTSFPKALGTVVTERIVDTILMLLLVGTVFLFQFRELADFFDITGLSFNHLFEKFTQTGIFVTILCVVCIIALVVFLVSRLAIMRKVKTLMTELVEGITSLKNVKKLSLYILYSVGIWVAYFMHYYLTFFCFDFMDGMGMTAGLVSFCVGTIAVIVPTPNGAGPWHFAVKTVLVIYGLGAAQAVTFALIVHSVQTLLLVILGIYALAALQISPATTKKSMKNLFEHQ